jgi:hypothetical protein
VLPDSWREAFLLPVKKEVRAEGIDAGDQVAVSLRLAED